MQYLNDPVSLDPDFYYSRQNTDPRETLKFISDDYVMLDVDDLSIIPDTVQEYLKTHNKFILCDDDLQYLYELDPQILHNMSHLVYSGSELYEYIDDFKQLKYLELSEIENIDKIINNLPFGLEALVITVWRLADLSINNLPITLKYLYIHSCINYDMLPINLEVLVIASENSDESHLLDNLPPNLKILLIMCEKINYSLTNLPASLEYLAVVSNSCHNQVKYTQLLTNLPSDLQYCILDHNMYYANKDSILATNPNCIVSNDLNMSKQYNITKLFRVTVEPDQLDTP